MRTLGELREASRPVPGALLDNMTLDLLAACVREGKGKLVLEASGGLKPGTLRAVAATGVDCLSLGYLTHSVRAADRHGPEPLLNAPPGSIASSKVSPPCRGSGAWSCTNEPRRPMTTLASSRP